MGLFSALFGGALKRLEQRVQGPAARAGDFVALAERRKVEGDPAGALAVLRRGAARFPESDQLRRSLAALDVTERARQKERLRAQIANTPNPILYSRLAELYRRDGELAECLSVCQTADQLYPQYGGFQFIMAQVFLGRNETAAARAALEQAVALDRYNYQALKLLGELMLRLGDPAAAAQQFEAILVFAPGDGTVTRLLADARGRAAKGGKDPAGPRPPTPPAPSGEEQTEFLAQALPRGSVTAVPVGPAAPTVRVTPAALTATTALPVAAAPRKASALQETKVLERESAAPPATSLPATPAPRVSSVSPTDCAARLGGFLRVPGVRAVLLVDRNGLLIGVESGEGIDAGEELTGAIVTNLFRVADKTTRQMGLGPLAEGLIEGEAVNLHLHLLGEMILAIFVGRETMRGLLEREIHAFLEAVGDKA